MGFNKYILMGKTPIVCNDLMKWAKWMEIKKRIVKQEKVGRYRVSTIFLGLDHSFMDGAEPLLFETMIFLSTPPTKEKKGEKFEDYYKRMKGRNKFEDNQWRYHTWSEALAGHWMAVAKVKEHG